MSEPAPGPGPSSSSAAAAAPAAPNGTPTADGASSDPTSPTSNAEAGPSILSPPIPPTAHVSASASGSGSSQKGEGENGTLSRLSSERGRERERDETDAERIAQLEHELAVVRGEKDALGNQYRSLLGKLTAMRTSLGDKLREDAEELDRRETTINALSSDNASLQNSITTLRSELESASAESSNLQNQLAQLRSQSDSSSSDVLSLTREMRELRGEMERLRVEREEWEGEAGRERERREIMEEEVRQVERREREERRELQRAHEELEMERERANNLQEVLSEFQAAKDSELRQATSELETQLRLAATSLSEFKLRAANAETRLSEVSSNAKRSVALEKEMREKNQLVAKLRHDAVVNNEHLTEALRRLRKNSSDNNVDRRLVTNILLAFLTTSRSDTKRFEMLSLLSTILSWDDNEREKAGLQRKGAAGAELVKDKKGRGKGKERSAEEEAAMNESFSNLFVEFLLKEASQGQPSRPTAGVQRTDSQTSITSPFSPPPMSLPSYSPTTSGYNSPFQSRHRTLSMSSNVSNSTDRGPPGSGTGGRKASQGLREAMESPGGHTYH